MQQVPWSKEAPYRLPVSVWREAIDVHFPDTAWIKMSRQTLDELLRFKTRAALPTWDATLATLLAEAADQALGAAGPVRWSVSHDAQPEHLAQARKVADAILYEGYLLYPYRQSSQKNQTRFQFGVLMPPAYAELDPSEPSATQTECLVECARRRRGPGHGPVPAVAAAMCAGGSGAPAGRARLPAMVDVPRHGGRAPSSPPGTRRSSAKSGSPPWPTS